MSLDALKDANFVIGAKQVAKAVRKGMAIRVYIADDADDNVTLPIEMLCRDNGVLLERVPTMAELGCACRIDVGAAAAAVLSVA